MEFVYTPELKAYMKEKNKKHIIVEVDSSDSSDFEVTELHVHFVSERQAELFKKRKKFQGISTEMGEVLLPPYHLEYEQTVKFFLKKVLFLKMVGYEGIRL